MEQNAPQKRRFRHKYRVAISFAGSQRQFAEAIALGLRKEGIRVFYDHFEQHVLWGRNLHEELAKIYNQFCRYCIVILTTDYLERMRRQIAIFFVQMGKRKGPAVSKSSRFDRRRYEGIT